MIPIPIFLGLVIMLILFAIATWKIIRDAAERYANRESAAREYVETELRNMGIAIKKDDAAPTPTAEPGVEVGELELNGEFRCPVCQTATKRDENIVECLKCKTPYHKECAKSFDNQTCAIYGCVGIFLTTP